MRLTLKTLLSQSVQVNEVIVIDQSGDDKTKAVTSEEFERAAKQSGAAPALRYVQDTSITGVSQARNRDAVDRLFQDGKRRSQRTNYGSFERT